MNLDKALRAMQHCEAWSNSVQAACLFAGKEYGERVLQTMTRRFLDDLEYDPATLEVSVPVGIGDSLLEAVEEYTPPVEPTPGAGLVPAQSELAATLAPIVQDATVRAVNDVLTVLTDIPFESEDV